MAAMGEAEQGVALRELKQACEAMRGALEDLYALKKAPGQERHGSNHHGERGHSHHHHHHNHDGPVDKAAALKAQRWKVLKLLSSMKAGLRDSFLAADDWKARVQEQKNRVEAHQLKLQNLLYEKDHLLREIRRCRGFSTKEMDKIEFEGGSIPIAVDADVHRQHLDQLTREHATRKQLQAELKELKEKIEQVDAASQTKQTFLDGLRSQVDGIEDATKGLQGYMGKPVTAQLRRQHAAGQLPTPLYALYCELEAYQSASDTSRQLTLEVVTASGLKHSGAGHLKRGFPTALVNANASANTSERGRSSSKRPKRQPSRSPSVANGTPGATPTPSRSPSEGHSKDTQEEPESGEIVATHTADKLLALRPHDDKSKEDDRMEVDDDSSRTAPSIDPSAKLERRHIESEAKEGDEDALVDASTVIVNLWEPSEKALLLTVSVASGASTTDKLDSSSAATINGSFTVMFQYFPTTKIVTAEIVNSVPIGFAHGHHNVLMNLFPGDDGLETPRAANNYTFAGSSDGSGVPVEFEFPASATCRPYHWAQWVCGLYPLKRVEEGSALQEASPPRRPEPSIRSVMDQLVKRFVVAVHLKNHLEQLAKAARMSETVISMDPAARHLFPDVPTTQLVDWKEVSAPHFDLFQLFKNQQRSQRQRQLGTPSFQLPTTGCRYFRAEFRNGTTRLPAMVEISPEYPVRAPRFLFQPRATSGSTKTVENGQLPLYENQLKEIEIEVNAFYNELIPHGCERFLLMHQLHKVLQCVDVLSRGSAGQPALCFGRERRGKDRRQAIVMDTASKELSHR